MDCAEIDVDASPEAVWATLADAKTFEYWVVGCKEVRVDIEIQPRDGDGTTVVMRERVVEGPMTRVPDRVNGMLLHGRNLESLRRLRMLAEERAPLE
jgi:hypothetical protein